MWGVVGRKDALVNSIITFWVIFINLKWKTLIGLNDIIFFCSDYQTGGDNNYEAIPNRKYEVPDELPPVPGTRLPGIHLMDLPPIPGSRLGSTEELPVQLPPKKKPIHFIRDPNFFAHVSFESSLKFCLFKWNCSFTGKSVIWFISNTIIMTSLNFLSFNNVVYSLWLSWP